MRQNRTLSLTSVSATDQPADVDRVGGQQVERDALRALRADAGQPAELVDEVLDRAFVHGSRPRSPAGRGCHRCRRRADPSSGRRARRRPGSRRAPRRRRGPAASRRRRGRPPSGSIVSAVSSPAPVIVARTSPPPAVPLTSVCGELFLRSHQLLLHLLRLLHQLLHVRLRATEPSRRGYHARWQATGRCGAQRAIRRCGTGHSTRRTCVAVDLRLRYAHRSEQRTANPRPGCR